MMVLVGLEVLQIRALHSQSSVSVSLERVVLEGASQATSGSAASNVEICMCPANYRGESCQVPKKLKYHCLRMEHENLVKMYS